MIRLLGAVLCVFLLSACTGNAAVSNSTAAMPAGSAPATDAPPPLPVGQTAGWTMAFSDEFDEPSLDTSRWSAHSDAEPDQGQGNLGNQQLEWNQAANCTLSDGALVMTAKRQAFTSPSGQHYDWTSCLLTTARSYTFQYGYIEERAILPAAQGFWPAFWTWQARGNNVHTETDVYEYYSDNRTKLYLTQYSGAQGRCDWQPSFDPSQDWHTYGAAIAPTGTTWYVDGKQVCHTDATSDGPTSIITNLAVYSKIAPDSGTSEATKRVDYIRAWAAS